MRTGVILPSFRADADAAFAAAGQAAAAGLDGVFCYDHLWPMGQPERPALAPFPLLAAIARANPGLLVGTLVARIGLVPDHVVVAEFDALAAIAPGRVIAGLGTGDRLSAAENEAYGVPMGTPDERRRSLAACASALVERGITVWVGSGSTRTVALAAELGIALNMWAASPGEVAAQVARSEVTWAGPTPVPGDGAQAIGPLVADLAGAGATWAVFGWPAPLDEVAALGTWAG
jgi:alkanesulfonate monooxygenase SsuD/methylene tetrahydromethanopterin reductase-like flavin-dependent oxidoreductase (luciferase family)